MEAGARGWYFQKSLSQPLELLESNPKPPKSQRLPLWSAQVAALARAPGLFVVAGVPTAPYTPDKPHVPFVPFGQLVRLLPPIHAHSFTEGLNSQRSFR
jgi:hypothetical protein